MDGAFSVGESDDLLNYRPVKIGELVPFARASFDP